ncbi:MAG: aldo/keto reductase [Myxococcota bacterium]
MTRPARIGLGLAALGRPQYMNLGHDADLAGVTQVAALEARSHAVLDAAFDAGVRYFDAARSYGRAEVFLKRWLDRRGLEPGAVTVASKWGYTYTANWQRDVEVHEEKDHSLANLERQWELSRAQLWEYLDVYQIHSATLESGVLEDGEVLSALAGLRRDRGLRIGLSVSGPRQADVLRRALEARRDGQPLFQVVQATLNLLERSVAPALAEAKEAGLTVVVKEGLSNGRLAGRDRSGRSPELHKRLSEGEASPDAAALAALLARPYVDVVLSGASTLEQLRSNLSASAVPAEEAQALWDQTEPEAPEDYWTFRKTLPWT